MYSALEPETTHADSIEVGVPLPFPDTDTFSLIQCNVHPLAFDTVPLTTGNISDVKDSMVFRPKPVDTILFVHPEIKTVQPYISYVSHPKPLKASEMRSTKTGGENIQYLDVEQGLASSQVNCIAQDKFGFLWFGMSNGLTRYDGNYLTHYTTENGLPSNNIAKIFFDSLQTMWIATKGGLVHYDGVSMKIYNRQSGLAENSILDINQDSKGNIWFVIENGGLARLKDNQLAHYSDSSGLKSNGVTCIGVDARDRIFVGYFGGPPDFIGENDSLFRYRYAWDFFGSDIQNMVFKDQDDRLWLGNYGGGAVRISEHDEAVRYMPQTGISYRSLNEIEQDKKGRMWFASVEAGIAFMENGKYTAYTTKQGLTSNYVTDLFEDNAGNMWVATLGGGVNKIIPESFRIYNNSDGLSDKSVSSIHLNSKNKLMFGTWADGPWIMDDSLFYRTSNHIAGVIVFDMEEDYFGNTILGVHQHGTYMITPGGGDSMTYPTLQNLHDNPEFKPWGIRKIIRDEKDNLWLFDDTHGIFRMILSEDKSRYEYCIRNTVQNGLNSNAIVYAAIDSSNVIWISQLGNGISAFKNDSVTNYTTKNGLPSNFVRTMYVDSENKLWLATEKGITILQNGKFSQISAKDNLTSNSVTSFVEDNKRRMWVGTQNGLNLLERDSSASCGYSITGFTTKDGLRSTDFLTHCAVIDPDNNAWWSTRAGIVKLDLNVFDKKKIQPQVKILNIELMNQDISFRALIDSIEKKSDYLLNDSVTKLNEAEIGEMTPFFDFPSHLSLPYYINSIGFAFSAMNGNAGHEIEYRHRLIGLEENWTNWSTVSEIKYDNLSPDSYTLELQSRLVNKSPGEIINYSFEIRPPFWQTWWFRIFMLSIFVLIIYLIFKWRNRALIERQQQLEKTVNERTQEIQYQKTLIEEKQIEILDSINYAQRIQRALLATDEILNRNLPEHFVFFQPKDIVSGDFYWGAETEKNKFLLVTADSTGHGVPGAIMSMLNISALEKAVESDKLYEPAEVLNAARKKIISTLAKDGSAEGGKDGMDCSLIHFDFNKMEISFSGANNGIWIFRNGIMLDFEPDRMPVGKHLRDKIPFNQIEIPIIKGDLIFMFTDGFADQFGGDKGKKFKYKSLKNVLIENAQLTMKEQGYRLGEILQQWKGELEQVDDICVIGIKI